MAGLVAALFIAASPAHRAYATDIMLESLGAALSLLALYCYLLTVQGQPDETGKARCLAAALLLLFLEKYNYWLLVVLALSPPRGSPDGDSISKQLATFCTASTGGVGPRGSFAIRFPGASRFWCS